MFTEIVSFDRNPLIPCLFGRLFGPIAAAQEEKDEEEAEAGRDSHDYFLFSLYKKNGDETTAAVPRNNAFSLLLVIQAVNRFKCLCLRIMLSE